MANKKISANLIFDGNSHISGVTKVYVDSDAATGTEAVRLIQMNTALALKQNVLTAGTTIDSTAFTAGTLNVKADGINDTHIDWGVGVNQVNAADIPVVDTANDFVATTVEATLKEIWDRPAYITIVEFFTQEFLEIRDGLVPYMIPPIYNGRRITGFAAKVITKNDDVTIELTRNGATIASSSTTITSTALTSSATLNQTIATGDIILVKTTAVGTTFSKGLIVNITIEI